MRVLAFSGGKDSMACLHLFRETLDCAIYVDTGKAYPETEDMVRYAGSIIPVITVQTDQESQNQREGLPSDIVPINWTRLGQSMTSPKPVMIQSYLACCFENIAYPLLTKAREIGATEIVYGQRNDENHRATSRDGDVVEGMVRLHPIEHWTAKMVLEYLAVMMDVPKHYAIKHSSLDCYDCTAFRQDSQDRLDLTRVNHPDLYRKYAHRRTQLNQSLAEALGEEE
ncbi:MAG TPA: phosphoadenosine phosphosulfate reductase family protein [Nitrosospira sp.]|nr:phosphoadenosine phosphosulfate reductase family protein [Nitrosospira sp.]